MKVLLFFLGRGTSLDIEPESGIDLLGIQVESVTGISTDHQRLISRGSVVDSDSAVASLSDGQPIVAISVPPQWHSQRSAADPKQQQRNPQAVAMAGKLAAMAEQVRQHEDDEAQAMAISLLPMDEIESAAAKLCEATRMAARDAVVVALARWFKTRFFAWMDSPACPRCGAKTTTAIGSGVPTEDDLQFGGNRVELFACKRCLGGSLPLSPLGALRFVRYNSPIKLLQTRCGRCGEWANCFLLFLRALGYDARMVIDLTDHVWVEVYSEALKRWVHCDCCEAQWDKPLTYERGWKKRLTYVIAFSCEEVVDVTRRYTEHFDDEVLPRRAEMTEAEFSSVVASLDTRLFSSLSPERRTAVAQRKVMEQMDLISGSSQRGGDFGGRVSGSAEWRRERGEDGGSSATGGLSLGDWVSKAKSARCLFESLRGCPGLALVGDATASGDKLVLTGSSNDQRGAAWSPLPPAETCSGVISEFTFAITESSGADGFAVVLQGESASAIGDGGCQLGYGGIPRSVAVEFDTYESWDSCDDPNGNHISVHARRNGAPNTAHHSASVACNAAIPHLADGRTHSAAVSFVWSTNTVLVWLDGSLVIDCKCDVAASLGGPPSAPKWIGFTAATGGLCQTHSILSWKCSSVEL